MTVPPGSTDSSSCQQCTVPAPFFARLRCCYTLPVTRLGTHTDTQVLHSRSRARKHPPERISEPVVERIIQMRDAPPEGLRRTPGPKAILYYLPRDSDLQAERLPRSSRTIYRILQQAGRIAHRLPHVQEELARPAPLSRWQLDFNDAATVPADPDGKRQHVVEVLNAVDEGTSVL